MKSPQKRQRTLSLKTAIAVPPWRKADITHQAQTIVRVNHCTMHPSTVQLEDGAVLRHDRRNPEPFDVNALPWPTLAPGDTLRLRVANGAKSERIEAELLVTEVW